MTFLLHWPECILLFWIAENKEVPVTKHTKEEQDNETVNVKSSSPTVQNSEQGSTLRDLLTTTAGKLRLGSTDAGIAFAPVYSAGNPVSVSRMAAVQICRKVIVLSGTSMLKQFELQKS